MKKKLVLLTTLLLYLSVCFSFAAVNTVYLGETAPKTIPEMVAFNKSILNRNQECIYKVRMSFDFTPLKADDFVKAYEMAAKDSAKSPMYFADSMDQYGNTELLYYYTGKADAVFNTVKEAKAYLDKKSRTGLPDKFTLKLNNFSSKSNNKYAGILNYFDHHQRVCTGYSIAGDGAVFTYEKIAAYGHPVVKYYQVTSPLEYTEALKDAFSNFYDRIVITTPQLNKSDYDGYREFTALSYKMGETTYVKRFCAETVQTGQGVQHNIAITYTDQPSVCKSQYLSALAKAKEIVLAQTSSSMSPYEKIKALHDYATSHIAYNRLEASFSIDQPYSQTVSSALIDNDANWIGYPWALKILLNEAGIENNIISGRFKDYPDSYSFWNQVKLGDHWYHIDATMDNTESYSINFADRYLSTNYVYFMVDDKWISKTREFNTLLFPPCKDSSQEYYSTKGMHIDTADILEQQIIDCVSRNEKELSFRSDNFQEEWLNTNRLRQYFYDKKFRGHFFNYEKNMDVITVHLIYY